MSRDRLDSTVRRDGIRCLHLASSALKGTQAVLDLWKSHREWPHLTVVHNPKFEFPRVQAPNVSQIFEYLPDEEIQRLQNECIIHICPSEMEGFGHYIMEGLSCEAIVITTDAPPMNEHIQPNHGLLVAYESSAPHYLGHRYYVDRNALEHMIEHALAMPEERRRSIGDNARQYYKTQRVTFQNRFYDVMTEIVNIAKLRSPWRWKYPRRRCASIPRSDRSRARRYNDLPGVHATVQAKS